ncbi:MAG: flagellar hook-length control protein FliK [Spirochaetota bacterium]|nr:flagellar hook-length control protein FliK [Spirochaetota bacterium]
MIEMVTSVKTQALSQKKHQSKLSANNTFQDQLDKSISNQKNLSEELREQKIYDKKKELESLKTKIKALKDEKNESLDAKEHNKLLETLAPLEELLDFLQNMIENVDSVEESSVIKSSTESVDLLTWIDTVTNFIEISADEISSTGVLNDTSYFSAQKFSFLLENIDDQPDLLLQKNDLTTMNTMMNIFVESNNIINSSIQDEILMTAMLNEMEVIEPSKLDISLSEENILKKDLTMKSSEFNMNKDDSSDSDPNNIEQKLAIKDLRTKSANPLNEAVEQSFSLENIDNVVIATEAESTTNTEIQSSKNSINNEHTTIAQKLYTSLSSSVSRVQVEALMQNMAGRMSILLQDGKNELRMKLTPPELGQMKLSFITQDNIMVGKIVVETLEAKIFFEQNLDNLRESLAQSGVKLGNIDIDLGSQSDFSSDMKDESEGFLQAVRTKSLDNNIEQQTERKSMVRDLLVDFTA